MGRLCVVVCVWPWRPCFNPVALAKSARSSQSAMICSRIAMMLQAFRSNRGCMFTKLLCGFSKFVNYPSLTYLTSGLVSNKSFLTVVFRSCAIELLGTLSALNGVAVRSPFLETHRRLLCLQNSSTLFGACFAVAFVDACLIPTCTRIFMLDSCCRRAHSSWRPRKPSSERSNH